ncbi:MAG: caspase family protein, partial [Bacteroidota bacterium]
TMNILFKIIFIFYLASFSRLSAQDYRSLNSFKYMIVHQDQFRKQNRFACVKDQIETVLSQAQFPVFRSKEELAALDPQDCEILEVNYRASSGISIPFPYVKVEIQMVDCKGKIIYSFKGQRSSSGIFLEKSFERAVGKALKPLRKLTYQYEPGALVQQNLPQAEPEKANLPLSDVDQNRPQAKAKNPHAIAVIIGNQHYQDKDIPMVDFAQKDAQSMKNYLVQSFGYSPENVLYYEDASLANFNAIFGTAQNHKGLLYNYVKAEESDVFIYYSGHGAPSPEDKTAYFIPVDCSAELVNLNGYSVNTFYDNVARLPFRNLTLVIDACFSGLSEGGNIIPQASPIYIKSQSKILNHPRALVFLSADGDQISSWYAEKQHSLFTYFFLKGIQGAANHNGDRFLDLGELREYIDKEVIYRARRLHNRNQTPEIYGKEDTRFFSY